MLTPEDILTRVPVSLAAVLVGAYYGIQLYDKIIERRRNGKTGEHPVSHHSEDRLERERDLNHIKEHVSDHAESIMKNVDLTRHDIRANVGTLTGTIQVNIMELGKQIASLREVIILLPENIRKALR